MPIFTDPNDPTNTYGQAIQDRVSDYAAKLGKALLGSGTATDATNAGQTAYRTYAEQAIAAGRQPLSLEQWSIANRPFN